MLQTLWVYQQSLLLVRMQNAADLITSDIDPHDEPFITGERTPEGFYRTTAGVDQAIARGLCLCTIC